MRILFIVLLSLCCRGGQRGIELLQASQQNWVAGIRGGGAGTNYEFIFKAGSSSKDLIINDLWIEDQRLEFSVSRAFPALPTDGFKKGDSVYVNATRFFEVEGFTPPEPLSGKPPVEYKGDALIGYTIKGRKKLMTIEKIQVHQSQQYE